MRTIVNIFAAAIILLSSAGFSGEVVETTAALVAAGRDGAVGTTVEIAAGTYELAAPLELKLGMTLQGAGMDGTIVTHVAGCKPTTTTLREPEMKMDGTTGLVAFAPTTVLVQQSNVANAGLQSFANPIGDGADPWVVRDTANDRYLWCIAKETRAISIQPCDSITSLGEEHIVWQSPESGPYSREVWAPELHFLDDRWHIYFAASDGKNENHLAYVLKSETTDPLGRYDLHGPLATGEGHDQRSPNIWAIDMTVMEVGSMRYAIWSGWDAPGTDQQYLYISAMNSPTELAGPRIRLCNNNDHAWEETEPNESGRGLNEAPQVFQAGGKTCIVYSCGASWLPTYKLGLLELVGDNPLDPASWSKRSKPVFESTETIYGVGHSCFVKSPDGKQWWHAFHAKRDRRPGWPRVIRVQPMQIDNEGCPVFGKPLEIKTIERPSGDTFGTVESSRSEKVD